MASKTRFGVIGLGWPGQQHIRGIAQNGTRGQVVAVADVSEQRVQNAGNLYKEIGIKPPEKAYTSAEELIADPNVDAVCIALPNYLHGPVAVAALNKGKHVFTEKPPTLNAKESEQVLKAARKKNLKYMYVVQRRYQPDSQALRKFIQGGKLGEVYYAEATWCRARGIPIGAGGWFVDRSRSGGGAMIDIGVHMLDAAWFFMGSPKPVSVSGSVFHKLRHLVPKDIQFDVDDFGVGLIKFENGATLLLRASWAINQPERDQAHVKIFGTKAGARYEPATIIEWDKKNVLQENVLKKKATKRNAFGEMISHFLDCIAKDEEPITGPEEALNLMRMLDGVYKSSETGREVRLQG